MIVINTLLLFGTWLIFSQRFDALHLGLGLLSSILVALGTRHLLFRDRTKGFKEHVREVLLFPYFASWLMYQIILSNFYVLYLSLHPRMKELIEPRVIRFKSDRLKGEFAHYVMAHSITLTPGTVTMLLEDGEFTVHALTAKTAEGLPSSMDEHVAQVFNSGGQINE